MLSQHGGKLLSLSSKIIVNYVCTAKNQYQKLETNIPRKGIARPQSTMFTFMCLWAIYIFPRSICPFCCRKYVDRSWEYINRSQTHECGNWDWGRAIPRKGIHKCHFPCSVVHMPLKRQNSEKENQVSLGNNTFPANSAGPTAGSRHAKYLIGRS